MCSTINLIHSGVVRRFGSVCALCAALAVPASAQNNTDNNGVKMTAQDTVDITVQDTDLAQVLQMLSIQSQKNIIVSKSVSGTVTANLYNVTFYEALDSILQINGYGYFENGNFIYVHTLEELKAMQDAQRKTESRVYKLQYLSAADANAMIAGSLSDRGAASYHGDSAPGFVPDVSDGGADGYAYSAMLVVNDYPDNLDNIANIIAEADVPPQQVLVESYILQTTLNENDAFGVDFNIIGSLDFTDLTSPLSAVTNLLNGSDASDGFQPDDNEAFAGQSTVGNTSGPGGFKVGVVTNDVSVFLRMLDEVTNTYVLARPKVMALNRQRAEVLVGARVGYLSTTATETTTTQTVEFLDTGIHLVFRPFISPNGMIRMELSPSVSEASLRNVTDSQGSLVTIPDELTNELTTNVRVRDGETLVLGGLFRESTRTTRRQVPGLGDIPLVGYAFRGHDDTIDRSEIIFLITPSIVEDEKLWAYGDEMRSYTDDVRLGFREGTLFFSNERNAREYLLKADDAMQRGDTEMALCYVNMSLRLKPQQPDALRLREQITGQKVRDYERSLQQRAIEKVLGPMTERHMVGEPAPVDPSFADQAWPSKSSNNGSSYESDPFQLNTDGFNSEGNWDYDSNGKWNSSSDSNWKSNNSNWKSDSNSSWNSSNDQSQTGASDGYKWNSSTGKFESLNEGQSGSSSKSGSAGTQSNTTSDKTSSTTSGASSKSWTSSATSGKSGASASGPSKDEQQRMSIEFLNDLYTTLGLPPIESGSGSSASSQNGDSSFPFTTFDEATSSANGESNPY